MVQHPVVVGLTLCETIIVDADTRNVTLVNCFSRRVVPAVPTTLAPFMVFATLTDGMGTMPLSVQILRLDTLDPVYEYENTVRFTDPLAELRVRLQVRGCTFPIAGVYQVQLLAGDHLLAQRRLQVLLREERS